jgi:hypothetical protein
LGAGFLCYNSRGSSPARKPKGILNVERKYRTASRDELKNPDYSYIKRDLRRILLIAGSFLVVMIALKFIIR